MVERERKEEEKEVVVFSDDANFVSGLLKNKKLKVVRVFSSTPNLCRAIKSCIVTIPLDRVTTLCPGKSEESTDRLLSELSSYEDIDIIISSYPYQVSEEFLEKFSGRILIPKDTNSDSPEEFIKGFTVLTPEILHQQSRFRVNLADRDIA